MNCFVRVICHGVLLNPLERAGFLVFGVRRSTAFNTQVGLRQSERFQGLSLLDDCTDAINLKRVITRDWTTIGQP